MGDVDHSEFSGRGSTRGGDEFHIDLVDCSSASYPDQPWNFYQSTNANIRLEGSGGSVIVDASQGVLGLNAEATASGVGVQILQENGQPVVLGVDTPLANVAPGQGSLRLSMKAHYIQTSDSAKQVMPGTANATAIFTLTYK